MMTVLFTSHRPLNRAENIKAVWDAYDGEKHFIQLALFRDNEELSSDKYSVLVTDEFVRAAPKTCIFIGHGVPATKYFGLDQFRPYHTPYDARLLTYVISPSDYPYMKLLMARQCGVHENQVLAYGMPRTDVYFKRKKKPKDKRIYLYAPTYRAIDEGIDPMESTDFRLIDELLTDDEEFIVKAHMLEEDPSLEYKHIRVASNNIASAEYIMNCDVLITDYSSIMFDAYLCNKPCVLFARDKSLYLQNRGMYFIYPNNYASWFADNETDLIDLVRNVRGLTKTEKLVKELTTNRCDGHSTERVIELIKGAI